MVLGVAIRNPAASTTRRGPISRAGGNLSENSKLRWVRRRGRGRHELEVAVVANSVVAFVLALCVLVIVLRYSK